LKVGILTPVLSLVPGGHSPWECDGTIDDVRRVAEAADRLGYAYLTCSEHMAIPLDGVDLPGSTYWDPLSTFGFLAAYTTRIRLVTSVLVMAYHHPIEIAKRFGTLDRICGGRLTLGLGAGYLEKEFELLGAEFEDRGPRTDDAIRALRASFGRRQPSYQGTYYQFGDIIVDPHGAQQDIPMWIGGRTPRSLRRAVELGDGWCPFAVSARRAAEWLTKASNTAAWENRSAPLEVIMGTRRPLDPSAASEQALDELRALRDAGVTTASLRFEHTSVTHYVEQLEAMINLLPAL
jgi:probable F420-dependent oxidoreductase